MIRRADELRVVTLTPGRRASAAALIAAEHRASGPAASTGFGEEDVCDAALVELLADGFDGFAALVDDEVVGVMCVRVAGGVAFAPAHGLAIRPHDGDPTSIAIALLAAATPRVLDAGATRMTLDHVASDEISRAWHDAGFGGGGVFAVRPTTSLSTDTAQVRVRLGTERDLDAIAELSHIEMRYRFQPPTHALEPERSLDQARALHATALERGSLHLIAEVDGRDVGLLTLEDDAPAQRLCPAGAYIGPTATRPDVRGRGIGTALVAAAIDAARARGHRQLSVDFASANALSRPFWLGLGFTPTGERVRRVLRLGRAEPVGGS